MTPERWQRVKELFETALERDAGERGAFLDRACAGDDSLRDTVEKLVVSYEQDRGFMERPAVAAAAHSLLDERAPSLLGRSISHYEVVGEIGRGGMGDVYLAQDSRLGRQVALKLLPTVFTTDPDRVRRFEQEARAASALNHPNACIIYEVGMTESGQHFIAMEYIEGETLRARLAREPMSIGEALRVAAHVARAIAAAHERGIVHRDLKPENVMLRPDGYAKVLDFGLAKLTGPAGGPKAAESAAATPPLVETETGVVMGTVNYMSPEQAQGRHVDQRSDVFSFGTMLYEMLTGEQPFHRGSSVDTLHAIVHDEAPRLAASELGVPATLEEVLQRCLEKRPEDRFPSGRELALALEAIEVNSRPRGASAGVAGRPRFRSRLKRFVWLGAVSALLLAGAAVYLLRPSPGPALPMRSVPFTTFQGKEYDPAFSPDDSRLAFCWSGEEGDGPGIYVQLLGAGRPLRVAGGAGNYSSPAWSRDGTYIAFIRFSPGASGVFVVPSLGGAERKLHDLDPEIAGAARGLDWTRNGDQILFVDRERARSDSTTIYSVSVTDLSQHRLTSPSAIPGDSTPRVSPDGATMAFVREHSPGKQDIYLQPVAGGEPKRVTFDDAWLGGLAWTPDGREIVFSSSRETGFRLWRVAVPGGAPEPISVDGPGFGWIALSHAGDRLACTRDVRDTNVWRVKVGGAPGQRAVPTPTPLISSSRGDGLGPQAYAPNGTQVAFWSDRSGSPEGWKCDSEGRDPVQVTRFGSPVVGTPHWSPDGRWLACDARPSDLKGDIYIIDPDGGAPRRLTTDPAEDTLPSWSADGRWIYFMSTRSGEPRIWRTPAEGGEAVQVTRSEGFTSATSPDGKILYFVTSISGPSLLWSVPADGGEGAVVSDEVRTWPFSWTVTGQGIYFLDAGASPLRVARFGFATRRVTTVATLDERASGSGIAVSPDERWLLYSQSDQSGSDIMLVENFR